VRELPPGQYVLENMPLDPPSEKAARIGAELAGLLPGGAAGALKQVLRRNQVPIGEYQYGTRSSMIVTVPETGRPEILVADGPPGEAPFAGAAVSW
jgi:hypothetical protein